MGDKRKEISKRKYNNKVKSQLFLWLLCNPICIIMYGVSWFHLFSLCCYGRLHKNIPILTACLLFWIGYLIYYIIRYFKIKKKSISSIYTMVKVGNSSVICGNETQEITFEYPEIKWYRITKNSVYVFLSGNRMVWIELWEMDEANKTYLKLKLSVRGMFHRFFWIVPAVILVIFITIMGGYKVGKSAINFNGKLAWLINDLEDRRTIKLEHDNVYTDGIEGLLWDIRTKIDIPDTLSLATGFNMFFLPDGTIQSVDTKLYGFDENGEFVNSYLITYDANKSNKMSIHLNGSFEAQYDADEDFSKLVESVEVIPLEATVAEWDEDVYGILYYGVREWNYCDKGVLYINNQGITEWPDETEYVISGYSISVFCPENEDVNPMRYIYVGEKELMTESAEDKDIVVVKDVIPEEEKDLELKREQCSVERIQSSMLTTYTLSVKHKDGSISEVADLGTDEEFVVTNNHIYYTKVDELFCIDGYGQNEIKLSGDIAYNYIDSFDKEYLYCNVSRWGEISDKDGISGIRRIKTIAKISLDFNVHRTNNRASISTDYPLDQYGSVQEVTKSFYDINGEEVFYYGVEQFFLNDDIAYATVVNASLLEIYNLIITEWEKKGEKYAKYEVASEFDHFNDIVYFPTETMKFKNITYIGDKYLGIVLGGSAYMGGAHGEPYMESYTFDISTGRDVTIEEITGMDKQQIITAINEAFLEEQGFISFLDGTTAGETWYESYVEGTWGSGFYLSDKGICIYFGYEQIGNYYTGNVEVVIAY